MARQIATNSVWNTRERRDDMSGEIYTLYDLKPLRELRKALADGADPNEEAERHDHKPLLSAAGSDGSLLQVKALLKAGADPDCMDQRGRSPLHLAVQSGSAEKAAALLKAGADQDAVVPPEVHYLDEQGEPFSIKVDEPGLTPAMMAARRGDPNLWDVLRQYGASVDGALHAAVVGDMEAAWREEAQIEPVYQRVMMVPRLLQEGMDANAPCSAEFRVYRDPSGYGQLGIEIGGHGQTPLQLCVDADQGKGYGLPAAEVLIACGADPNAVDLFGQTSLHYAAIGGNVEFIKTLLSSGANLGARDDEGSTPRDVALAVWAANEQLAPAHARRNAEAAELLSAHEQVPSLTATVDAVRPVRGYGDPSATLSRPAKRRL